MPLTHLPPDARPREKLLARGPQALADAELLALLLRTGVQGTPVLQLAQGLLDRFGGWAGLLATGVQELGQVKGLGPAKRAEIAAVLEITRPLRSMRRPVIPAFSASAPRSIAPNSGSESNTMPMPPTTFASASGSRIAAW